MRKTFDVNTEPLIELTVKLERLHRSAFPSAVRNTLNNVAFETKRLVPKVASQKFTTRQKSFFKAFTVVNKASGFSVNKMRSVAGVNKSKGSRVAEGLEKQEKGGVIKGRKLIAHRNARVNRSDNKKVKAGFRLGRINISSKNKKGDRNYLLIKKGNKGTVFKVKRLKTKRKLTPIYHYRNHRDSQVRSSPFMEVSAKFASRKIDKFYKDNAEFQFKKALK